MTAWRGIRTFFPGELTEVFAARLGGGETVLFVLYAGGIVLGIFAHYAQSRRERLVERFLSFVELVGDLSEEFAGSPTPEGRLSIPYAAMREAAAGSEFLGLPEEDKRRAENAFRARVILEQRRAGRVNRRRMQDLAKAYDDELKEPVLADGLRKEAADGERLSEALGEVLPGRSARPGLAEALSLALETGKGGRYGPRDLRSAPEWEQLAYLALADAGLLLGEDRRVGDDDDLLADAGEAGGVSARVLDVDPGHDDAVAIALALSAPEVEVLAVTMVAGNASVEKTTRNALGVLSLLGREDVPVGAGAPSPLVRPASMDGARIHGEGGLGEFGESLAGGEDVSLRELSPDGRGALRLMADVVGASTTPVTLVPTGPLTNVANFLEGHPDLKGKVGRIVLMGGSVGLGNATPAAEFNVYLDPEAVRSVFASGVPITMCGLDVGRSARAGDELVGELRQMGGPASLVARIIESYAATYEKATGRKEPPLYDAVAVAAVVDARVLKTRALRVEVKCAGEHTLGATVCDLLGVWEREPNAEVGLELDEAAFFEVLRRSLGGPGSRT